MTMGPYSGKRVSAHNILYPRYQSVQELTGSATAAPAISSLAFEPAEDVKASKGKRQRADEPEANGTAPTASPAGDNATSAALYQAAAQAAAAGLDPEAVAALERKAAKRAKREARQRPSGTPNGAEPPAAQQGNGVAPTLTQAQTEAKPAAKQQKKKGPMSMDDIKAAIGYEDKSGNATAAVTPAVPAAVAATAAPAAAVATAQPASGAGAATNAAEAAKLRATLGYTAPVAAPVKQAPAQFGFGFAPDKAAASVAEQVAQETEAKIARIMAIDQSKDGFVPRRVWICGMPHEYSEQQIREYWSYCGEVEALDLLTFKDTGRFNGAMFITFTTDEAYKAALAAHGEELEGRKLRVEKCKASAVHRKNAAQPQQRPSSATPTPDTQRAAIAAQPQQPAAPVKSDPPQAQQQGTHAAADGGEDYNVAYVGNIAFDATAAELETLFKAHAPTQVRLHTDAKTGKPKGFAHVHFADAASLASALSLDGAQFHARNIKVLKAKPPSKKT